MHWQPALQLKKVLFSIPDAMLPCAGSAKAGRAAHQTGVEFLCAGHLVSFTGINNEAQVEIAVTDMPVHRRGEPQLQKVLPGRKRGITEP